MTSTVFMGAPAFSTPTLQALLDDPAYDVVAVVTQPDRRAGRGRKLTMTPVKQMALAAGVPVLQPSSLRDPDAFAELAAFQPELIVVAAFGQILRPNVLELPRYGCINVHASLLPRWRGASPIQAAILAGDPITGSTIMRMDEGMDTGPILAQAAEVIRPDDTAGALSQRLAQQGARLLIDTLPCYLEGKLAPRPQDDAAATVCRLIKKERARIDWTQPAAYIERMVRAYNPWPSAFTFWQGQMLKVGRAKAVEGEAEPGRVVAFERGAAVGTGAGLLALEQVQPAGKRMMSIADFLRGRPEFIGAKLDGC
ncbi:MAG: methionyl-tRNA formyltransferase [Chloroflexi bacterium]|nr:methionyl-tRNA formyltransferase [Chloroflexota bacterium]